MLLFEHKQYLQSFGIESSMQTEILSDISVSLMPTKMACRDYNELLPGFVTSQNQINPAPGNTQRRDEAMLRCFREEEEKTRGARKNRFIYESWFCLLTILMDSQVSKSMF